MKTKKQKISSYQKALQRMEKETARATAQVEVLSKMYTKITGKKI